MPAGPCRGAGLLSIAVPKRISERGTDPPSLGCRQGRRRVLLRPQASATRQWRHRSRRRKL